MATRNERKRRAKARHEELLVAVSQAFSVEAAKQAVIEKRQAALVAVQEESRPLNGIGLTRVTLSRIVKDAPQEIVPSKPNHITVKRGGKFIFLPRAKR